MSAYDELPILRSCDLVARQGSRVVIDGIVETSSGKVGPFFIVPEQSTSMHTDGMLMDNDNGKFIHWSRIMDRNPRIIPVCWIY